MIMSDNFQGNVDALIQGMDHFVTSKTVVGDARTVGDVTIIPLVDVSFGMAASSKGEEKKRGNGGGMGGKISPSALLVIQNGQTRLVNIKNQDAVTKIIDMAPDFVNRFSASIRGKSDEEKKVDKAAREVSDENRKNF